MNIKSMRLRSYRSFAVDEHVPPEAAERYRTLKAYERLRAARCNEVVALQQLGMSRRTRYRWQAALAAGGQRGLAPKSTRPRRVRQRAWKPRDVKAVMDVRRKYPFMGKARIQAMLARKGRHLSASTVGRIIERALAAGAIRRASFCEGRVKPKRRRRFAKWAMRWKYGSKARRPGELLQIDHMTYACGGQTLKEFRAVCPVSKFMVTRVYSRATAGNAKRFLMDLLGALPFPLLSVQVDGGSEFMAGFEDACEELRRTKGALTPARPAAPEAPMERLRRADKPLGADRVLEPLRRSADRGERRSRTCPLRILLQLRASAHIARLSNTERVPCRPGGCLVPSAKAVEPVQTLDRRGHPSHTRLLLGRGPLSHPNRPRPREHHPPATLRHRRHSLPIPPPRRHRAQTQPQAPPRRRLSENDGKHPPPHKTPAFQRENKLAVGR